MNRAFSGLRPDEATALQTLGEEATAIAVPPRAPFDAYSEPNRFDQQTAGHLRRIRLICGDLRFNGDPGSIADEASPSRPSR